MPEMIKGTIVKITDAGPFGTCDRIDAIRFQEETVQEGDQGSYWGPHRGQDEHFADWHWITFDGLGADGSDRFCPLPEGTFSEVTT